MTKPRALASTPWTLYAIDWRGTGWKEVGGVFMPSFTFGKRSAGKSNPWSVTLVIPKKIKDLFAANLLEAMQKNRNYWPNIEIRSTELMEFKAEDSTSIRVGLKGWNYGWIASFEETR